MRQILIVDGSLEDQAKARESLGQSYAVQIANTAAQAVDLMKKTKFDAVILEAGLPDGDGLNLCQQIRSDRKLEAVPVLFVSNRNETQDIVEGFRVGADDYITKPFAREVLSARVDARMRRPNKGPSSMDLVERGDLRFLVGTQKVVHIENGQEHDLGLTPNEFKILYHLACSDGETLSREAILQHVWGNSLHVVARTVDKHICSLRRKMGARASYVVSVPGQGYSFVAKS